MGNAIRLPGHRTLINRCRIWRSIRIQCPSLPAKEWSVWKSSKTPQILENLIVDLGKLSTALFFRLPGHQTYINRCKISWSIDSIFLSPSKRMVNMKKIKKRLNTIKNWWFSFWKPLATTWLHLLGHQTCNDRCKIAWAIDSIIRSLPANDQSRRNCPKCHKTFMSTKVNLLNRSYNCLWKVN